ncbi:MAG: PilX N-terminal domain-containing pilus assembly protein [Pseudomonadota bacterium]
MKRGRLIQAQQGVILIFCLIFLLVLSMMGMTGMQSAVLQERMAGNLVSHASAFHAAAAALTEAQEWLATQPLRPLPSTDGSSGVWWRDNPDPVGANAVPWWEEVDCLNSAWWQRYAREASDFQLLANGPHWLIEEFGVFTDSASDDEQVVSYRITARGTGHADSVPVLLQTIVVKTYPDE